MAKIHGQRVRIIYRQPNLISAVTLNVILVAENDKEPDPILVELVLN